MQKGDFILMELEGKDELGIIFDSTSGEIAKKLYGKEGPILSIVGITPMLKGIAEELLNMKENEERTVVLEPEKAFGFKNKENTMIVPLHEFKKLPKTGDLVRMTNGQAGVVKSISAGRVMIDMNHPLAGKVVVFKIKISGHLKNDKEKAEALFKENGIEIVEFSEDKVFIKDDIPDEAVSFLQNIFDKFNIKLNIRKMKKE